MARLLRPAPPRAGSPVVDLLARLLVGDPRFGPLSVGVGPVGVAAPVGRGVARVVGMGVFQHVDDWLPLLVRALALLRRE